MTAPQLTIPRFEVVRALGAGGGGSVHLVKDRAQGGALRALKMGLPDARSLDRGALMAAPSSAERNDTERLRAALLREARILSALRHPGIPRLFDVGAAADGSPWILMEYFPAPQPLPDDPVARRAIVTATARGLLDVLAYLHRKEGG